MALIESTVLGLGPCRRLKFKTEGASINCIGALGLSVGKIKRKNTRKMKEMKKGKEINKKESNERELIVNKGKKNERNGLERKKGRKVKKNPSF